MKKKKIGLLATLAITCVACLGASAGLWIHNVRAEETAEPVLVGGEIQEEYLLGDYLLIPDSQISFDGKTEDAKVVVTKPNGEVVQSTNVHLEQGGVYTIEYRAVIDGQLQRVYKEFTVQTPMFSGDSRNTFGVYGEDTSSCQTGVKGVNVSLAEGDVLHYNDVIDLNESGGHFLEFFLLPEEGPGTIDVRKLIITLTDAHDPSISLTTIAQCYRGSAADGSNWFFDYTYMLAGGQNQIPSGVENSKLHVGNEWGAPSYFSFYGQHGDNPVLGSETLKLVYNKEANAVIANGLKVVTLDDMNCFDQAWNGFTTGEVRLSIQGDGFSRPIAKMMITKIGENNLNQTLLKDDVAPEITIDYNGYDAENLPTAGKGFAYPVFSATARDKMSGSAPVQTTVYYNYESSQRYQVDVVDGMFKTDRTGYYTIEYLAEDAYNNLAKKTVKIECKETSPELSIEAIGEYVTSGATGEMIFPAEIAYNGGTGIVNTYATVKLGDGEEVPMDEGFRPEYEGSYTVTLYAVDMLGKVATAEYDLEVVLNEIPVFLDEVVLPRYFLAGYNYTLPSLGAYDYSNGKAYLSTTISVEDGDGIRELDGNVGCFVPDEEGYATIMYTAYGEMGEGTKEYKVPVIDAWVDQIEQTLDISKYFYGENITAVANDNDVSVTSTVDTEYSFVNPAIAHKFELQFTITENEFSCVQLIFTDAEDASIGFTVEIDKSADETVNSLLRINGVETRYNMAAGFYDGNGIYFYYDNVSKMLQDNAGLKQPIKNADGSMFEGFPSHKFYVTAKIIGVTGNATLAWTNFGGQVLNNAETDEIDPSILVVKDYKSSYSYQEVCEIYPAVVADILSPETVNSLTVYDPNGEIVTDLNGLALENVPYDQSYFVKLNYYGSYSVAYSAVDKSGITRDYYIALYVTDNVAPKIALEGEMQTEVQQGDTINVVKAIAMDNLDGEVTLYTYVYTPEGVTMKVENGGSFVAMYKGVYEIRYMSIDSFGNLQLTTYEVTVK